jgi:hypothetical protein
LACNLHSLNYPTAMSLGMASAHLSTSGGFLFSMQGCAGGGDSTLRSYSSRTFSIITTADLIFRNGFEG